MSNYEINEEQLAERFKALSNPHRLGLFRRLMTCCEPGTRCQPDEAIRFCVGDLGKGLEIAPSTLSCFQSPEFEYLKAKPPILIFTMGQALKLTVTAQWLHVKR